MSLVDMSKLDEENRDPSGINDHLRVSTVTCDSSNVLLFKTFSLIII